MITQEAVYAVLKSIYDPEIPVNIVDLGLIYGLSIDGGNVEILMTLTMPGCPMGAYIAKQVEEKVKAIEGVESVRVDITLDPPWSMDRITDEGKNILRGMGMNI